VLAAVAFVRDAALAEALKDVRRLESLNQQVSVSSTALTDKLAAVTADRNMKMKAMKHCSKTKRLGYQRRRQTQGPSTIRPLLRNEEEAKTAGNTVRELRQQLATESACTRSARLEAAHLQITMVENDNEMIAASQERACTREA